MKIKELDRCTCLYLNKFQWLEWSWFIIFKSNVIIKMRNPVEESSGVCQEKKHFVDKGVFLSIKIWPFNILCLFYMYIDTITLKSVGMVPFLR